MGVVVVAGSSSSSSRERQVCVCKMCEVWYSVKVVVQMWYVYGYKGAVELQCVCKGM